MNFLKNSFKLDSSPDKQIDSNWFVFSPLNVVLIPVAALSVFVLGNIRLFIGAVLIISIILFFQIC